MKKLIFAVVCTLVLAWFGLAGAASYTMGNGSWIDTSGTPTDFYLEMEAEMNPGLSGLTYSLDVGESETFLFATLSTPESWINGDDFNSATIMAYVDFTSPAIITQEVDGSSVGFTGSWLGLPDFYQGWTVTWSDPVLVNFGTGGQFMIELSDTQYSSDWWQGPDAGSADVYATVTHLADSGLNDVPEPATMLLLGLGLIGLAGITRKH